MDSGIISPHRTKRLWQGKQETPEQDNRPSYSPKCYLCYGNQSAGGRRNPTYKNTYVFTNDFAALLPDTEPEQHGTDSVFKSESVRGTSQVICFSPRHGLTLPEMPVVDGRRVVDLWAEQFADLGSKYKWVQVFENKGAIMGWHNAPTDDGDYYHWQLHAHFYPPLLRSATVKKFIVGYEMLAEAQRLRELSDVHYKII